MALCYKKLWKLLIDKDMTRASLREATGIAPATIAKMSRGESVGTSVLERICESLQCNIGDIVDYVPTILCGCCDASGLFGGNTRNGSGIITICTNSIASVSYVYDTIVHELIHAYDDCKGTDFSKCEQRACSEIRAYKNSGQCQLGGAHRKKIYLPFRNLRGYYDWYYETEEECLTLSAKASTMKDWMCIHNIDTYINDAYNNCADKKDPFDVHEGSR